MNARMDELVGRALCGLANVLCGTASRWVNCEPSTRQRLYYGNHSSHLDILVLWSCLPPEVRRLTRPAAARDYWETSPLRRYLVHRVFHAILIDRAHPGGGIAEAARSFEAVLQGMEERFSLILFPEGTRGTGEVLGSFKSGLYHIARSKPDLELVPVYMENLNRILPKGEILPVPLLGSISFGQPLRLAPGEGKLAFLQRARQALLDLAKL